MGSHCKNPGCPAAGGGGPMIKKEITVKYTLPNGRVVEKTITKEVPMGDIPPGMLNEQSDNESDAEDGEDDDDVQQMLAEVEEEERSRIERSMTAFQQARKKLMETENRLLGDPEGCPC